MNSVLADQVEVTERHNGRSGRNPRELVQFASKLMRWLAMTYDELVTKPDEDEFRYALPRDDKHMDGRDSRIKGVLPDRSVIISDGERSAAYMAKKPLDGELEIVPDYIEAGWYCEANEVERKAYRSLSAKRP